MKIIFALVAILVASQVDASAIGKDVDIKISFENKDPLSANRFCSCTDDGCQCIIKEYANSTEGSIVPFEEAAERAKRSCCK